MLGQRKVKYLFHHLLLCFLSARALGSPSGKLLGSGGSSIKPSDAVGSRTYNLQRQSVTARLYHSQKRHDRGSTPHDRMFLEGNDAPEVGKVHTLLSSRHGGGASLRDAEEQANGDLTSSSKIKRDRLRRQERKSSQQSISAAPHVVPSPNSSPNSDDSLSQKEALALLRELQNRPATGECKNTESPATVLELENKFPQSWTSYFMNQSKKVISTANVLNNVFQVWDSKPLSLYNEAYFYSLAKGLLSSEDKSTLAGTIAFDRNQYLVHSSDVSTEPPTTKSFAPSVRWLSSSESYASTDIAELTKSAYTTNGTAGYTWFWKQRKSFDEVLWDNRSMCNRSKSTTAREEYSASSLSGVTTTSAEGLWTSPYYDCQRTGDWVLTYSVPFFGCTPSDQILFKGVVAVDVALSSIDINQCDVTPEVNQDRKHVTNVPGSVFAGTHKCKSSTECVFTSGYGFRFGGYQCVCTSGFYSKTDSIYMGHMVESAYQDKLLNKSSIYDMGFSCDACGKGCGVGCRDGAPCYVDYNIMIRAISVGVVSFCMSVCIVLGIVVLRMRKSKVMKASMWILLEVILLGSLFLYSTVIIQYFEPTDVSCILIPWFREVGFAIVHGSIVLKIYRILSEFQSRKAHRVHVRDKDLLKYILTIVVVVVGFMAAWTAANLDYMMQDGISLVAEGHLQAEGLSFAMCRQLWWEYVVELGEFLLLVFGIYLCYRIRAAPSDYKERRYLSLAIYNETIVSTLTHIIRHTLWGIIHPDYIFLMYLIRCQLTVSLCVILVLGPKLWYAHRPPEDDHFRNRTYSASDVQDNVLPESMKLHAGVNSNGDVDLTDLNLSDMDPEDIRSELKRLYTQLQIFKTKTMRKDNPHISKRRGGRKQTHRRFSLQAFHHKHRHHHDHDHDHELSKTPEESTNSAEGVAYSIEESTCSMGELGDRRTPTVTFKPGHKSFY